MNKSRIEKVAIVFAALWSLLFAAAAPALAQTPSAGVRLQAAIAKEDVDGDVKSAIEMYQKIAGDKSAPRDVRSRALLRLAGCYEKLGRQAQQVYQQVVRDFADQPAAAQARARLAALRQAKAGPATMTQRRIELPVPDSPGAPARTDGRREVYVDANTGALVISDLAGKGKRVVFNPKAGERIVDHDISRDSSASLLALYGADGLHYAFVRNDGTGYQEWGPVSEFSADLSWDNRYVFTCATDPDGSRQLLRYSTSDGQVGKVQMACGEWNRPSPDGRFLAISDSSLFGKISVAPIEGGEPQLVSDNARLMDWTRDGRYLILAIARSGSEALYLFPVKDGRRSGDSILLRYGPCQFGWVNAEGALICESRGAVGNTAAWLGRLDSSGRSVEWKEWSPSAGSTRWFFSRDPWSPDSSRIAYTPEGAVRLHDLASGDDREVYRGAGYPSCAWLENAKLICAPYNGQPPIEVFSVSLDSGRVQPLGTIPEFAGGPYFASADGQSIYMWASGLGLIRWDLATRQTTIVHRFTVGAFVTNPTERWIARRKEQTIEIRPTAGGEWRPLISLPTTSMGFTPDGKWLLFHDVDAAGKHGLFRVSTSGGQRERIGDFPNVGPQELPILYVSPDGRKLLVEANLDQQVWILQNFEPKPPAAR